MNVKRIHFYTNVLYRPLQEHNESHQRQRQQSCHLVQVRQQLCFQMLVQKSQNVHPERYYGCQIVFNHMTGIQRTVHKSGIVSTPIRIVTTTNPNLSIGANELIRQQVEQNSPPNPDPMILADTQSEHQGHVPSHFSDSCDLLDLAIQLKSQFITCD